MRVSRWPPARRAAAPEATISQQRCCTVLYEIERIKNDRHPLKVQIFPRKINQDTYRTQEKSKSL